MTRPDEEARAKAYRESAGRRRGFTRSLRSALAGDAAAAKNVRAAWAPVVDDLRQRRSDA